MTFRWIAILLVGLSTAVLSRAESSPANFISNELGAIAPELRMKLDDEQQAVVKSILGVRCSKPYISCWQQDGKTAWVLQARGKVDLIDAGFVVEQGRIIKSEVLAFRETRGRQICSERFLKQFSGVFLKKNGTLSRKIDGYSGATYSVNAMRKMAQLALYLDSLIKLGVR